MLRLFLIIMLASIVLKSNVFEQEFTDSTGLKYIEYKSYSSVKLNYMSLLQNDIDDGMKDYFGLGISERSKNFIIEFELNFNSSDLSFGSLIISYINNWVDNKSYALGGGMGIEYYKLHSKIDKGFRENSEFVNIENNQG